MWSSFCLGSILSQIKQLLLSRGKKRIYLKFLFNDFKGASLNTIFFKFTQKCLDGDNFSCDFFIKNIGFF